MSKVSKTKIEGEGKRPMTTYHYLLFSFFFLVGFFLGYELGHYQGFLRAIRKLEEQSDEFMQELKKRLPAVISEALKKE